MCFAIALFRGLYATLHRYCFAYCMSHRPPGHKLRISSGRQNVKGKRDASVINLYETLGHVTNKIGRFEAKYFPLVTPGAILLQLPKLYRQPLFYAFCIFLTISINLVFYFSLNPYRWRFSLRAQPPFASTLP